MTNDELHKDLGKPLVMLKAWWPHVQIYDKQVEIIESVRDNYETVCVAGNMLGKDFISGFIALHFFLTRTPVRVVTTSADHSQLEAVLWGEIRRWIQTCNKPLTADKGGPIVENHLHLRKLVDGKARRMCGLSYMIGRTAAKGESLLGHHIAETGDGIPRTLFVVDEASGVEDIAYERATTWAKRILVIGNPFPCNNHFKRAVKGGDIYVNPDEQNGGVTV